MKKLFKNIAVAMSLSVVGAMALCFPTLQTSAVTVTNASGWYESAHITYSGEKPTTVTYQEKSGSHSGTVDEPLIRDGVIDIVGLKGNATYTIDIDGTTAEITTMAYDRSGYAHWNYEGVGAYNDDGTLAEGVDVLYVTNENMETITYNGKTGIFNILNQSGGASNLCIRLISTDGNPLEFTSEENAYQIGNPADVVARKNDGVNMLWLADSSNITIEGIGEVDLNRWGFWFRDCDDIEVRNLYIHQQPDDAVGVQGTLADGVLAPSEHIWVHNNTFDKGYNELAGIDGSGVDSDKSNGDGTCDIKRSQYVTVSYNIFNSTHKSSLVGGGDSDRQDFYTYHHNLFNQSGSRLPLIRYVPHAHYYNNWQYGTTDSGISARIGAEVFAEYNILEDAKKAYVESDEQSVIYSYNDTISDSTKKLLQAYVYHPVTEKTGFITGNEVYKTYNLDTDTDVAKEKIENYAGSMKDSTLQEGSATVVTEPESDYEYIVLEDGTAEITLYSANLINTPHIEIPAEIDGYTVTSIGEHAFEFAGFESIIIPDSVISIGDYAFYGLYNLTSITIPQNVTSIGEEAFANSEKLTSIIVSENNSKYCDIDGVLFDKDVTELIQYPGGRRSDTEYVIPEGVTTIGYNAFQLARLTSITFPDTLTTIGEGVFSHCYNLTSITLPDSVTEIGNYAFAYCKGLNSITIPANVTLIGESTFTDCEDLIISGYTGTYAETYALEEEIPFVSLDEYIPPETPRTLYGDLDLDNLVQMNDIITLCQAVAAEDITTVLSEQAILNADCCLDGIVDSADISVLANAMVNSKLGELPQRV